jgi:hypothetical protein
MGRHWNNPHAVYRIRNAAGELLYIGCSQSICGRLSGHSSTQPWAHAIARIDVEWFDDELLGRRAEAAAILAESPRYNVIQVEPDNVGMLEQNELERPRRGDGIHCPKCGGEIENKRPGKGYCDACYMIYRKNRREKILQRLNDRLTAR